MIHRSVIVPVRHQELEFLVHFEIVQAGFVGIKTLSVTLPPSEDSVDILLHFSCLCGASKRIIANLKHRMLNLHHTFGFEWIQVTLFYVLIPLPELKSVLHLFRELLGVKLVGWVLKSPGEKALLDFFVHALLQFGSCLWVVNTSILSVPIESFFQLSGSCRGSRTKAENPFTHALLDFLKWVDSSQLQVRLETVKIRIKKGVHLKFEFVSKPLGFGRLRCGIKFRLFDGLSFACLVPIKEMIHFSELVNLVA